MKRKKSHSVYLIFILISFLGFILLFTFSSLNLKNIDYGYRIQELLDSKKKLEEDIDQLKSIKASLLNLERVENIVMKRLNYQYPEPNQFIKVFED